MTKEDLVRTLRTTVELSHKDAGIVVESIFDQIARALHGGDKVEIRGFGSFRTRERRGRIARNPRTGARVDVPAKAIPFFTPGRHLKELLNPEL